MKPAKRTPSRVILNIQNFTIIVPSVKNRLKLTLISSSTSTAFRPRTINLNGTLVARITRARTAVAST